MVIIDPNVIEVVQQFFENGSLPKVLNCTYMSLLPKVVISTSVRDYQPITCCSVLYKIIYKTLTNRLQQVMHYLVSERQSEFVKWRVIFDNIFISHELSKGYGRKGVSPRWMLKINL